jgi:hypothetical protein
MLRLTVAVNNDVIDTITIVNQGPQSVSQELLREHRDARIYTWHSNDDAGQLLHYRDDGWAVLARKVLDQLDRSRRRAG